MACWARDHMCAIDRWQIRGIKYDQWGFAFAHHKFRKVRHICRGRISGAEHDDPDIRVEHLDGAVP